MTNEDMVWEARAELIRWSRRRDDFASIMTEIYRDLAVDLEQSGATDFSELEAFREARARRNLSAAGNVVDLSFPQIQAERLAIGQAACLEGHADTQPPSETPDGQRP